MGGPPMGGPPRSGARQGTSRLVPVVVSAGLAVGVFCGLLFGLGTGKSTAAPAGPVSNGVKRGEDPAAPESVKSSVGVKTPDKPSAGSNAGSAVAANAGSAAANAGSAVNAGSAGSAAPAGGSNEGSAAPAMAKLVIEIKPDMAGPTAKVTVDDKEIAGLATEIPMEPDVAKKRVKVKVRALGYRDANVEVEVSGETTLNVELVKGRSSLPATPVAGATTGEPANATAATATPTGTKATSGEGGGKATGNGNKGNGGNKGNSGSKGKGKGSGGLIDI